MPKIFFLFLVISLFFFSSPAQVSAARGEDCIRFNITGTTDPPQPIPEGLNLININFEGPLSGNYRLDFGRSGIAERLDAGRSASVAVDGRVSIPVSDSNDKLKKGIHGATLQTFDSSGNPSDICDIRYKVGFELNECSGSIRPPDPRDNEQFAYDVKNAPKGTYEVYVGKLEGIKKEEKSSKQIIVDDSGKGTIVMDPLKVIARINIGIEKGVRFYCKASFKVLPNGGAPPRPIPPEVSTTVTTVSTTSQIVLCTPPGGVLNSGVPTAIGCIPTEPVTLTKALLKFTVAIAGGIAFLLMVFGAFGMITSAGNPEALEASKDRFSKAIIGLLTVVFAVLLLKVIGVDILGLGAFLGV